MADVVHYERPPAEARLLGKKRRQRRKGGAVLGVLGFFLAIGTIVGGVYFYNTRFQDNKRTEFAESMLDYGPRKATPKDIDELKVAIKQYEDAVDLHVRDAAQTGTYWRMLGTKFRDKKMNLEAIDAYSHGLEYYPQDEGLHYIMGVTAGETAKSMYDTPTRTGEQERMFTTAVNALQRAIEVSPTGDYPEARYSLAALYVMDLDRPADAVPLLTQYIETRPNDSQGMFLMARACYMTQRYNDAIDWYNRGIPLEKDPAVVAQAKANIDSIRMMRR
jgi:tetratricopeptide (TPR) repeat protein